MFFALLATALTPAEINAEAAYELQYRGTYAACNGVDGWRIATPDPITDWPVELRPVLQHAEDAGKQMRLDLIPEALRSACGDMRQRLSQLASTVHDAQSAGRRERGQAAVACVRRYGVDKPAETNACIREAMEAQR